METLEIKKEAAIAAHENAKSSGKKLLEDLLGKKLFQKEVTDRIKTFDDVLDELEISKEEFTNAASVLESDEVAYRKVKLIAEALNEGWLPDWTDSNQYKYLPWFNMGGSSGSGFSFYGCGCWRTFSVCGSRLCFKSSELASYAGKQFEKIYKEFLTL
ncbi:MAG: hypothetical protein WBG90_05095 [Saonia sp.]